MTNQNSFTEATAELVRQVNVALEMVTKVNQSMTSQADSVTVEVEGTDPITGDPSTFVFSMPSYRNALDKINTLSNAMDAFINGEGQVLLNDGTFREVKTQPLSTPPAIMRDVAAPTKFYSKSNWFFENFITPLTHVKFDLKDKIPDNSDRVFVKRVIFDNFDDQETDWFKTNVVGNVFTYPDLLTLFRNNGKEWFEDDQITQLPLFSDVYFGEFTILSTTIENGNTWYFLDTINYGINTDASTLLDQILAVDDQIRYKENTLFKIEEIRTSENRIRLTPLAGIGNPIVGEKLYYYNQPFTQKITEIGVGYNECNSIFIKGIDDNYNITAGNWGNSISFYTGDLTFGDTGQSFDSYYFSKVTDFGKEMESRAKERIVPAFDGITPDAPVLAASQFRVVQVNNHINAALDTEAIRTTQTQIESTKTTINSLKTTISQQKAELVELTDPGQRANLQDKIDSNTSNLSKQTTEYQSLVKSLSTIAFENDAIINDPKYRLRGFFNIPEPKRTSDEADEIPQEIVQFDISYRYLRLDNTGNALETYTFEDPSTGEEVTGTYTDWIIRPTPVRSKTFDASLNVYKWNAEVISDGQEVNINQVDIPINRGEKVQIRIRSVSEAGWPINPVKSGWSNAVIVDFPSNLQGSDQVVNILNDAADEETTIALDETLSAAGLITHIDDSVPNPNAADGTFFKHASRFLAYDYKGNRDEATGIAATESTLDLQEYLDTLATKQYITITNPSGSNTKTVLLQTLFQRIINDSSTGQVMFDNL